MYDFTKAKYRRDQKEPVRPWHYENEDFSALCHRPEKSKWWDGGQPVNGHRCQTTASVKYVTCKRCLKIMKERGILRNE